ncbi:hypothetical protein [Rhizobium anhuiense]|uniref:Uncharacterized protein n=1 Tax=Rhizobium anhuiense TaxID=1184720 RepID=A0A432NXP1_9HYPH|nr:hypothetical protein [Rhizobium anhuiense]RUM04417.1 hypothetical protein EEQ99_02355 [Rhizobium anhuiense]GGD75336.1 hypothetical protein GCM10008012_19250 [Rhizobium anhuiense]
MKFLKEQPIVLKASGDPQPEVSGFGLLASAKIQDGKVTVTPIFSNKTSIELEITFRNSHYFIVDLEDAAGDVVHINDFLPPPLPSQPPLQIQPGQDYWINFPIDTSKPPYAGNLEFDPTKTPYRFRFQVNSDTFRAEASITIDVTS